MHWHWLTHHDWHWWIEKNGGLTLLVALVASFTSILIAIGTSIVNARTTRTALTKQIRAQTDALKLEQREQTNAHKRDIYTGYLGRLHQLVLWSHPSGLSGVTATDIQRLTDDLASDLGNMNFYLPESYDLAVKAYTAAADMAHAVFASKPEEERSKLNNVLVARRTELMEAMWADLGMAKPPNDTAVQGKKRDAA